MADLEQHLYAALLAAGLNIGPTRCYRKAVLRPTVDTLTRMIATARADAHRRIEQLLADELADGRRGELDALLDGGAGQSSELADLRRRASRAGVKELLGQVRHYRTLVELGATRIDVSALAPARRRTLESMGRRMTAQQLRRLEPARRHPLMLVLLHALVIERGDELLDLCAEARQAARRWPAAARRHPGPRA